MDIPTYLMWYDGSDKSPEEKVLDAIDAYTKRMKETPNMCEVPPDCDIDEDKVPVRIVYRQFTLPGCFLVGIEDDT